MAKAFFKEYNVVYEEKDGIIDGTLVVGAQPFSAFKAIIDQELEKIVK